MKKVIQWLKPTKVYGWTGAVWKFWVWAWPIYIVLEACINFYQATYDTPVWGVVAMWKITCMLFWGMLFLNQKLDKDIRKLDRDIRKLQDEHIEFLREQLTEAHDALRKIKEAVEQADQEAPK